MKQPAFKITACYCNHSYKNPYHNQGYSLPHHKSYGWSQSVAIDNTAAASLLGATELDQQNKGP